MNKSYNDLKNFWKNKKVFLTGHTGFKGTWLTIMLNMLEAKVAGYSLRPKKVPDKIAPVLPFSLVIYPSEIPPLKDKSNPEE